MEILYEKLIKGDPKAQVEIYEKFRNGYWSYLTRKYGDLPWGFLEECLQDGFLKIFKNVHQLKDPEKLREWGMTVVNNATKNKIRTEFNPKKPRITGIEKYIDQGYREPIEKNIDLQLVPNFLSAVRMGDKTRVVINLILQGYDHKGVSEELGISHIAAREFFYAGLRKIIKHKSLNSKI